MLEIRSSEISVFTSQQGVRVEPSKLSIPADVLAHFLVNH